MNKFFAISALGAILASMSFGAGAYRHHHYYRHHYRHHHHYYHHHHSHALIHIKL